ncbi:MAG: extensin family protein [Rhizobiales bacterium]|nr:extensin family protein [Hyphomicrobiales bacterium]
MRRGRCDSDPSRLGDVSRLGRINEGNGCQVPNPYSVRSIAGVHFSQPATLNCGMVAPVHDWMENTVQPAAGNAFGERVVSVDIAASYSCRPRNNKRGAKMSEHGYGNALDISAFTLESGKKVTVLGDWGGGKDGRFLREIRGEACGQFATVLGPGSDRHHRDHFHLDLQQRRSGKAYCR